MVFSSRTNHTGVENSRPDFLPDTVICSSTEESRAFCISELFTQVDDSPGLIYPLLPRP